MSEMIERVAKAIEAAAFRVDEEFFTVVFKGKLSEIDANPFQVQTIFGTVQTCGTGDAFSYIEQLKAEIARLEYICSNHAAAIRNDIALVTQPDRA